MKHAKQSKQTKIDLEVKAHKKASDKAYREAKKATALVNKIMRENHFNLAIILSVGDKRKKHD